jgi:hypothetical protein
VEISLLLVAVALANDAVQTDQGGLQLDGMDHRRVEESQAQGVV